MPVYVRVRDPETRHEFDMPEGHPHITKGLVEVIKSDRFPPSPVMRRPKHHLKLAVPSAAKERRRPPESQETTPKETQHG